jgi:isoquinoline 1-oxidoreductase alpha subunit
MPINLTVNGRPHTLDIDPETPLLWALRDTLDLTGTKYGCGIAQCGACTVLVDGTAIRACVTPISAVDRQEVTTIEGLSRDRSHPLQQAFVASNVPQCGFCIPGIIMAGAVLLKKSRNPTDEEIDAAITNLCRCGVYPRLRDAIKRAGRVMRGEERIAAAPPPGITPEDAARAVPALTVTE